MIDDATIVARFNAEEARLGGLHDKNGNITTPRVFELTAEALGISQADVARAYSRSLTMQGAG